MCTGAEIPAAMAAAAAGTTGAAAATEGTALTGAALSSALSSGGLEAGLLGTEAAASPAALGQAGMSALTSAAPEAMSMQTPGMLEPMMSAAGGSSPQELLPMMNYGPEMAQLTDTALNTGPSLFDRVGNAASMYSKAQPGMNALRGEHSPAPAGRPKSMTNPDNFNQAPFAARPIGTRGPLGGGGAIGMGSGLHSAAARASAAEMIRRRMGLLG